MTRLYDEFDIGHDAKQLTHILRTCTDIWRSIRRDEFWTREICVILLSAIKRVLDYGEGRYPRSLINPTWKEDDSSRSIYAYCVECLDHYMFFMDDLLYYNIQGGGALRVLCKRGIKCYYASVLRLQFKLHNSMMNL
jgi:hypothetical protein